jgi:chromosome partitioning protein
MMKTVVFAGSKGGCGRTTLAFNVAIEAAKTASVLLVDVDPQRSLTDLWARRDEPRNPRLVASASSVMEVLNRFRDSERARQYLIADTPGSNMRILTDAIGAADAVVLPVQPSPIDLVAQQAVVDLIIKLGKEERTIFALNRLDARTDLGPQSLAWLLRNYGLPVVEIRQRASYLRSAIIGKAAGEIDKDAVKEIAALWKAVREKAV